MSPVTTSVGGLLSRRSPSSNRTLAPPDTVRLPVIVGEFSTESTDAPESTTSPAKGPPKISVSAPSAPQLSTSSVLVAARKTVPEPPSSTPAPPQACRVPVNKLSSVTSSAMRPPPPPPAKPVCPEPPSAEMVPPPASALAVIQMLPPEPPEPLPVDCPLASSTPSRVRVPATSSRIAPPPKPPSWPPVSPPWLPGSTGAVIDP